MHIKTTMLVFVAAAGLAAGPAEAHLHPWSGVRAPASWSGRALAGHRAVAVGGGGLASWYGPGLGGHRTASGERFNGGALTAAHRFFPFGTRVLVTNRRTGRSVVVRINDRGPFAPGRVIDLSYAASRAIGMTGTDPVILARL